MLLGSEAFAGVNWRATIILPDQTEKTYEVSTGKMKFYLPKTKWTCFVTRQKEGWTQVPGGKIKRLSRDIKCVNMRGKDELAVHVKCFDMPDQLEANSISITDEKRQAFN